MDNLEPNKSTRHSKITGDFAEYLILYWLSKYGFECAYVDHVGIDLIARNPSTLEVMGISVKSRSRNRGKEGQYLSIPNENFSKIDSACYAFDCIPYFAIVVDEANEINAYLLSKSKLLAMFPMRERVSAWKMNRKWRQVYEEDPEIFHFQFKTETKTWW